MIAKYCTSYNEFSYCNNRLYIRRDDLYPFSFGGNKAIKASYIFEDILKGKFDTVVTYGSLSSNHCRVVANLASLNGLECILITPKEDSVTTSNLKLSQIFGAKRIFVNIDEVKNTIEEVLSDLEKKHQKAYFIPGGGHCILGTHSYKEVFKEITEFENEKEVKIDYIFFASGTGTTQAGLEIGKLLYESSIDIVGISIARAQAYGKGIITEAISDYLKEFNLSCDIPDIEFNTDYLLGGYGKYNPEVLNIIREVMSKMGISLDVCYTGKAFYGMTEYIKKNNINGKNLLFIHTGGAPVFFDNLKELV